MKTKFTNCLVAFVLSSSLNADTIKSDIADVLKTNPTVIEKLNNYRATQQDLEIAQAGYYPKLDFSASRGYTDAGQLKDYPTNSTWENAVTDQEFEHYEASLTLTQNIFDGFATSSQVDYQKARGLAAAYKYLEVSNHVSFQMTENYINVLKTHDLIKTAKENLEINQRTYDKVKKLYDSGLTAESEVVKIQSSLSLAKSNLTVAQNNFREAQYAYKRLLGRMPVISEMKTPSLEITMPENIEKAASYAIENNPSIIVGVNNIQGAKSLKEYNTKGYYPNIDLQLSQNYNDITESNDWNSPDDRFIAKIVLTYNFYNGGADKASIQKSISNIHQEVQTKRDLQRQVIEGLELSWTSYEMLQERLKDLQEYKVFSDKTLMLYKDEYDLGRRTLLDLLSAQNDVINAKNEIINAQYNFLFAKFRVLDAMGLLVVTVLGDNQELTNNVNLNPNMKEQQILDELPVSFDVDGDTIVNDKDLCDNSLNSNGVLPSGCIEEARDSDLDGVLDAVDQCKMTPLNAKVDAKGCALDTDKDGILDHEDKCPNSKEGAIVDQNGCAVEENVFRNIDQLEQLQGTNENKNLLNSEAKKPLASGQFIQIGVYSKKPSQEYLKYINDMGYLTSVEEFQSNGKSFHKILVGPFENILKSKNILSKVQKDLNVKDAFIKY